MPDRVTDLMLPLALLRFITEMLRSDFIATKPLGASDVNSVEVALPPCSIGRPLATACRILF